MLEDVKSRTLFKKDDKKTDSASENVVNYINMKEGGHYMYGIGFLFSQVGLAITQLPKWKPW